MEGIFIKLLEQLNSAVFVLVAILIIAFWAVYKLGGIVKLFSHFQDKNKEIDGSIAAIKDTLSTINATTKLLYEEHLSTVKSHSLVSLTEKGKEVSQAVKAEEKVAQHWQEIKAKLEEKNPKNPYDIHVAALDIAKDCFDSLLSAEEKDEIKLYAYKIGMNLLEIYPIFGILLRDQYLKEKNISVEEIDQHTP